MAYDDSLAKLEEFNALLAKTLGELQEGTSELETEGNGFDQSADDAAQKIGALEEQLSEWLDRLGSLGEETGGGLEDLSQAASAGADDRLSAIDDSLDQAEATAAERVDTGQETLETGFAELREQGFQAMKTALDESSSESEALDGELTQDFAELASAVAAAREQMVAAGQEMTQELAEAQQEADQHDSSVGEAADALTSGVEAQQGTAASDCEAMGDGLDGAYDAWSSEAASAADEYASAIESAFADAAEAVGAAGEELAQAVDRAREQSLGARESDLGESGSVLESGDQMAGVLEPIVSDLEIVLRVVDQIQQLLSEMG